MTEPTPRLDWRFAIGAAEGPRSSGWHIFTSKHTSDVYVARRASGGIDKFSFHESGICRWAFTKEHGAPGKMSDRAIMKWRRAPTPPQGELGESLVLKLALPTDYLSMRVNERNRPMTWITAAPAGMAIFVDMFFTNEDNETLLRQFEERDDRTLLALHRLPGGEAFTVTAVAINDWQNRDLRIPASHGEAGDLLFSVADPFETGRPIRLVTLSNPGDGDALHILERGGYKLEAGQQVVSTVPEDRLDRQTVLEKRGAFS